MSQAADEPANLVLELLRTMRAENSAQFEQIKGEMSSMQKDIADIKRELRGLKLNTIAEVYKANLTVASFADHERRITALEQRAP